MVCCCVWLRIMNLLVHWPIIKMAALSHDEAWSRNLSPSTPYLAKGSRTRATRTRSPSRVPGGNQE